MENDEKKKDAGKRSISPLSQPFASRHYAFYSIFIFLDISMTSFSHSHLHRVLTVARERTAHPFQRTIEYISRKKSEESDDDERLNPSGTKDPEVDELSISYYG